MLVRSERKIRDCYLVYIADPTLLDTTAELTIPSAPLYSTVTRSELRGPDWCRLVPIACTATCGKVGLGAAMTCISRFQTLMQYGAPECDGEPHL